MLGLTLVSPAGLPFLLATPPPPPNKASSELPSISYFPRAGLAYSG